MARAAQALVGARFRLHGRDPASGLDCVGVVAVALGDDAVPTGYALRGGDPVRIGALLDARLSRADGRCVGDVLLFAVGAGQLHLAVASGAVASGAIASGGRFVHADAGLGRVVERGGVAPWVLIGAWRRQDGRGDG